MADTIDTARLAIINLIPLQLTVKGNLVELEELFSQLISNAAKFSPKDSTLTIEAACNNCVVTVAFKDDGIGLLPEELCYIFDDFYKADHSRHLLNSSGLGLTISRRIVENHGGRITASSPGKMCGTTIQFTLESGGIYERSGIEPGASRHIPIDAG
jgi:signal transduction histidine kinase